MRELGAESGPGGCRTTGRLMLFAVAVVLCTQWGCCKQVGPIVVHGDLKRDDVIRQLGAPSFDEVVSVADLSRRQLIRDKVLAERVKLLEPSRRVELAKWETSCWIGDGDYFIAVFDAETGRILEKDGKLLLTGRTVL
jgi:hypothetical protein